MLLSRDIVRDVLLPRLAAVAREEGGVRGSGAQAVPWYMTLLAYHDARAAECRQAHTSGRFYTWTEYGLYFVAAVSSGALDAYHVFDEGGPTSERRSIMSPEEYDRADWDGIFTDGSEDGSPLFLVHSWFNKPLETTNGHLARHIPAMADPASWTLPVAPSPEPFYNDRKRAPP
jgi:hypothetical protein